MGQTCHQADHSAQCGWHLQRHAPGHFGLAFRRRRTSGGFHLQLDLMILEWYVGKLKRVVFTCHSLEHKELDLENLQRYAYEPSTGKHTCFS